MHTSEKHMLSRSYVGLFVNERLFLDQDNSFHITCADLNRAWWVISDATDLILKRIKILKLNKNDAKSLDIRFSRGELNSILMATLNFCSDKANFILNLFTCNSSNAKQLFNKGVWSHPLIQCTDEEYLIVGSVLAVGCAIRRVESWLEQGGLTNQRDFRAKGLVFEDHVRRIISSNLEKNNILRDTHCLDDAITIGNEEIDMLFRVGNTIFVCEIKCLLTPHDQHQRYNYYKKLIAASKQVSRKIIAVKNNIDKILKILNTTNENITVIPIVILNQGFGVGILQNGAYVTDLNYLSILTSGGSYNAGSANLKGKPFTEYRILYKTNLEFESNIGNLLTNVESLSRYNGNLKWKSQPINSSLLKYKGFEIDLNYSFDSVYLSDWPIHPGSMAELFKRSQ